VINEIRARVNAPESLRIAIMMHLKKKKSSNKKEKARSPCHRSLSRVHHQKRIKSERVPKFQQPMRMKIPHLHDDPEKKSVSSFPFLPPYSIIAVV
jgi:hypothetical protein